ncbi:unnamed protein product [Cochlearia groenlandica]
MRTISLWCIVLTTMTVTTLLPVPTAAGRVEIKNEINGLPNRKAKVAVRCWSNDDDLGWDVLKPGEGRRWKFTTMNMWPFKKTEFRCQLQSGLGTTNEDRVTVFSVSDGFRKDCEGDVCVWVAKRDGFYQRRIVKNVISVDVIRSKWVWKW